MENKVSIKAFFEKPIVRAKFAELLGKRSTQFMTSVMQIVSNNNLLSKATPESIYGAAIAACILDLPIQNNLGFTYIVPYKGQAQFQIGYKGIIQLALRSGQYQNIAVTEIFDGQILTQNPLTGYVFDFEKKGSEVIGYAAYFRLLNGFEKIDYMPKEKIEQHAKKYSQNYKNNSGIWVSDFDSMAKKTVIKKLISTYGPMSTEMKQAIIFDQAVTNDGETISYIDNQEIIETTHEEMEKASQILTQKTE